MASLVDLTNDVIFNKGIKVGDSDIKGCESEYDASNDFCGLIRYNKETNRFQGLHHNETKDEFGNTWRNFGLDMATNHTLGGIKIGSNLNMDYKTGILSAITHPNSTLQQKVITISSVENKGDYNDLHSAIYDCFGTYYHNYEDGILTDERNLSFISTLNNDNKFITIEFTKPIFKDSKSLTFNDFKLRYGNSSLLSQLTRKINIRIVYLDISQNLISISPHK